MIDRRFGARIGLKRELVVSVVVNTSLGAASSGKVKKITKYETRKQPNRIYGSIFSSTLLVKVVWDKISGHT